jgi:transposase-like protein
VRYIPKDLKEQILQRVKEEGVSVAQAARDAGINPKTIYNWMQRNTAGDRSYLEISRLKRENTELLTIIGKLTQTLEKSKKN